MEPNDSVSYIDTLLDKWNKDLAFLFLPLDVILLIFIIIGVVGNSIVVFIYKFRMTGKMKDRYFIPVLALVDGLVCLIGPSITLALSILPVKFYGDALCKGLIFMFRVPLNVSVLLTFVIGLFRYRKVCKANNSLMTLTKCRIAIGITFAVGIITAIPVVFFYGEVPVTKTLQYGAIMANVTGKRCGLKDKEPAISIGMKIYLVLCFLIILIVVVSIIVFYSCIGHKIYQTSKTQMRSRSISSRTSSETDSHSQISSKGDGSFRLTSNRSNNSTKLSLSTSTLNRIRNFSIKSPESPTSPTSPFGVRPPFQYPKVKVPHVSRRYTLLFMAISIFFILAYIPTLVINLILNWDSPMYWETLTDDQLQGYSFVFFTYFLNHVINPFFYAYFDSSFRKRVLESVTCT